MISREILEAQRANYIQGREVTMAQLSALNGGIDAMDNLLRILDQMDEPTATDGAKAPVEQEEKSHA